MTFLPTIQSIRVFAALAVALCLGLFASTVCGQQIHLRSNAQLHSSIVRLGDIAEIVGGSLAEKSALQKLELFPVDPVNPVVSVSQVRDELSIAGVDLLRWRLVGSNQIRLSAVQASQPVATVAYHQSLRPGLRQTPTAKNNLPQNTLRRSNRGEQPFPATQSAQAFVHPNQQLTQVGVQQAAFQQPVDVSADNDPKPRFTVWTVRDDKSRGVMVGQSDIESIEVDRSNSSYVTDPKEIVGKVVRNRLIAGQPIRKNSLEDLKYVERGKMVRIISKVNIISVSTTGRCLADATLGQEVTVESLDRSKKYIGTVTDFQTVTLANENSNDTIVASHNDHESGYRTVANGTGLPTPVGAKQPGRLQSSSYQRQANIPPSLMQNGSPAIRSNRLPTNSLR